MLTNLDFLVAVRMLSTGTKNCFLEVPNFKSRPIEQLNKKRSKRKQFTEIENTTPHKEKKEEKIQKERGKNTRKNEIGVESLCCELNELSESGL